MIAEKRVTKLFVKLTLFTPVNSTNSTTIFLRKFKAQKKGEF